MRILTATRRPSNPVTGPIGDRNPLADRRALLHAAGVDALRAGDISAALAAAAWEAALLDEQDDLDPPAPTPTRPGGRGVAS